MLNEWIQAGCWVALLLVAPLPGRAQALAYEPRTVALPKDAAYLRADGSIAIVGEDAMLPILTKFNVLFVETHPGFKFWMALKGSATGIGAIADGVTAFAPMGREARPTELFAFRQRWGYDTTEVRIGYNGYGGPARKTPPGIYVHAGTPIPGLTVDQIRRILTIGGATGTIASWNELGLGGPWAKRRIHVYGPQDDGGFATALRMTKFGGRPFAPSYEALDGVPALLDAIAADPFGLALINTVDSRKVPSAAVMVPLATADGAPFALPTYEQVRAGHYPFSYCTHLYFNRRPGAPLDPLAKEYARLALSSEGQAIIASESNGPEGFVPLRPDEIAGELAKLE